MNYVLSPAWLQKLIFLLKPCLVFVVGDSFNLQAFVAVSTPHISLPPEDKITRPVTVCILLSISPFCTPGRSLAILLSTSSHRQAYPNKKQIFVVDA